MRTRKSSAERQAKTKIEKNAWAEARFRSETLLAYATRLNEFLHGHAGSPALVNDVWQEAEAVRYALNTAVSIRVARAEERKNEAAKRGAARLRDKRRIR